MPDAAADARFAGNPAVVGATGSGSTFTLELPAAANAAPVIPNAPDVLAPPEPLRISCIADSAMLDVLQAKLGARVGLAVLRAVTGASGLDLARQHEPDLIVLGADAPELSAREVAQRLQNSALTRQIPRLDVGAQLLDDAAGFWRDLARAGRVNVLWKRAKISCKG